MRYYSKKQMQAMEEQAVERGVSMEMLMESAGAAAAHVIREKFSLDGKRVTILCGKGNNGGDGFVVARLLRDTGAYLSVVLAEGFPATDLARNAYGRMGPNVMVTDWKREPRAVRQAISAADVLVDGLYGFGFRGRMPEHLEVLTELANRTRIPIVSLDIPSGVECDTGAVHGMCIRARYTVAFTVPKPAHALYPGCEYCGEVIPAAAGIAPEIVCRTVPVLESIEGDWVKSQLPKRHSQSNKGDYGKLLCVCGSEGMAGAAMMCGMAALRCGAGLVNLALPRTIYPIAASRLLESVYTLLDWQHGSLSVSSLEQLRKALSGISACVAGCGLGSAPGIRWLVKEVLMNSTCPLVLDADALNSLCGNLDWLHAADKNRPIVLTPHPGEMARLAGMTVSEVQSNRLAVATEFAQKWGVVLVLKGAGTLVALPDGRCYLNHTGNPGMARGGSGDILAGMVGSFIAQGIEASAAARIAVYLHGLAGDRCAEKFSMQGMLPTDMLSQLPSLFLEME